MISRFSLMLAVMGVSAGLIFALAGPASYVAPCLAMGLFLIVWSQIAHEQDQSANQWEQIIKTQQMVQQLAVYVDKKFAEVQK